jgi:hypothetical protein
MILAGLAVCRAGGREPVQDPETHTKEVLK